MRILVTSDFHGFLPPTLPETDLLIIAGDVGGWDPLGRSEETWLADAFEPWLRRQKAKWIVGIAGNHDFAARRNPQAFRDLPWLYLQDEAAEVGGFRVYGSPWSNPFGSWAFMDTDDRLAKKWAQIPDDTEILIVHGPARGANDEVYRGERVGSVSLRERIRDLPKLQLLVTGHIHEGYGTTYLPETFGDALKRKPKDGIRWVTAINGSYVGSTYQAGNPPIALTLIPRENEKEVIAK